MPTSEPTEAARVPSRARRLTRVAFDAVLAVGVLYMVFLIGSAAVGVSNRRTELRLLRHEAHSLYDAFAGYEERNRSFPASFGASAFDRTTLDPLRRRGYYRGAITALARNARVDAYDAPDDHGSDREYWVELSLRSDPTVRVLVAHSDDAPLSGGLWLDGVFVFRDGALEAD